jgi:hypothetical protein
VRYVAAILLAMPHKQQKAPAMSAEELQKALDVKPPSDPQALEDHVHQLLMRAQVSWLSKRDVLDILSNWQAYNLPISLMPPDQPGRTPLLAELLSRRACFANLQRVAAPDVCDVCPCGCASTAGTEVRKRFTGFYSTVRHLWPAAACCL